MTRIVTNINEIIESANGQVPGFGPDPKQQLLRTILGADVLHHCALKLQESIPPGSLGGVLEEMVNAVAGRLQTPNGLAAACALGAVSAALGGGLCIASRPGMKSYPNLYILAGTPSGGSKTTTADPILQPIYHVQQERIDQWRRNEFPSLMAEKDSLEYKRKALLHPTKNKVLIDRNTDSLMEIHRRLLEIDNALIEPRLFVENATTEALVKQMAANDGVLASISTDARELIGIISGKYRKSGDTDEGGYLKFWSNESYDSPRIGRNVPPMKFTCLTALWLTQPDKIRQMFITRGFTEGGLLPRFLLCMADYVPQPIRRDQIDLVNPIYPRWDRLIRDLIDEYHDGETRQLQITSEAVDVLDAHFNSIAAQYTTLKPCWAYASRWTEQAWRLTIILHAAFHGRNAHLQTVQADTAGAAVAIIDWFREHQLLMIGGSQAMRLSELVQNVLSLFEANPTISINVTDLTRKRIVADAEKARALLEWMCPEYLVCQEAAPARGGHTVKDYLLKQAIPTVQVLDRVARDAQPT